MQELAIKVKARSEEIKVAESSELQD